MNIAEKYSPRLSAKELVRNPDLHNLRRLASMAGYNVKPAFGQLIKGICNRDAKEVISTLNKYDDCKDIEKYLIINGILAKNNKSNLIDSVFYENLNLKKNEAFKEEIIKQSIEKIPDIFYEGEFLVGRDKGLFFLTKYNGETLSDLHKYHDRLLLNKIISLKDKSALESIVEMFFPQTNKTVAKALYKEIPKLSVVC